MEILPGDSYRYLVEQAPDAMLYADGIGTIRVWNQGAERLFGYTAAEALGRSLDLVIPEKFRAAHWHGFAAAMQSGSTRYLGRLLTTRSAHKDGRTIYVEMAFSMIRNDAGTITGALAIARDCTERHLAARTAR